MSTGLGSTVDPAGAPGSLQHAVPLQGETLPDNPAQIVQSTATQDLNQLLNYNWIWDSTFTVSTTMPAGTILFTKPVHPKEWNWPNKHVAQMFNVWTGTGVVRYRPLATAWYGGSVRVGFLPPNLTTEQIQNMSLDKLTSYPNRDIDPKNTDWVDFRPPDQRNVAYHYMKEFDPTDPQCFGGYVVFYLAGKLVTQSAEFTTISFLVELAGAFSWEQPSPNFQSLAAKDPLADLNNMPLHLHTILDTGYSGSDLNLTLLPANVNQVGTLGINFSTVGRAKAATTIVPGFSVNNRDVLKEVSKPVSAFNPNVVDTTTEQSPPSPHVTRPEGFCANFSAKTLDLDTLFLIGESFNAPPLMTVAKNKNFNGTSWEYYPSEVKTVERNPENLKPAFAVIGQVILNDTASYNPSNAETFTTMRKLVATESIVIFTADLAGQAAFQTAQIAWCLGKYPSDQTDATVSWIYAVTNKNGTPLFLVRLCPNGLFTTNAVSSQVSYPFEGLVLKYQYTLPLSSPLPPQSMEQRFLNRRIREITLNEAPGKVFIKLLAETSF